MTKHPEPEKGRAGDKRADEGAGKDGKPDGADENTLSEDAVEKLIVEESVLTGKEHDPNFVDEIVRHGGKDVQTCLQCGNCTGVCPVSLKTPYKTRNLIKLCQYGYKRIFFTIPWICAGCYRCYEHCPADINPAEVFTAIRHILVRDKGAPAFLREMVAILMRYGQNNVPSDDIRKFREKEGLPPLWPDEKDYDAVLRELKLLFDATGYDRLMGLGKEDGK